MEVDVDRVATGGTARTGVPEAFGGPFGEALDNDSGLGRDTIRSGQRLGAHLSASAGEPVQRACPACADGRLRLGRYSPFVSCADFPRCRYPRPLAPSIRLRDAKATGTAQSAKKTP